MPSGRIQKASGAFFACLARPDGLEYGVPLLGGLRSVAAGFESALGVDQRVLESPGLEVFRRSFQKRRYEIVEECLGAAVVAEALFRDDLEGLLQSTVT